MKLAVLVAALIVAMPSWLVAQTSGPEVGVSDPPTSVDLSDLPPGPFPRVSMQVVGGFVPGIVHLDVMIDTDELVHVTRGEESRAFRLDTDTALRLKTLLGAIPWGSLAKVYRIAPYGADMPEIVLKGYPGGYTEGAYTVGLAHVSDPSLPKATKALTSMVAFLNAAAGAVLGDPAKGLTASLSGYTKTDKAYFFARLRNSGPEATGILYANFGYPQFLVRRWGKLVYDSSAMLKYVKIAFIPRVHVLFPGESWKLTHEWDYHRNVPEAFGGARVSPGLYQVKVKFAQALSEGVTSSAWYWIYVPPAPVEEEDGILDALDSATD